MQQLCVGCALGGTLVCGCCVGTRVPTVEARLDCSNAGGCTLSRFVAGVRHGDVRNCCQWLHAAQGVRLVLFCILFLVSRTDGGRVLS